MADIKVFGLNPKGLDSLLAQVEASLRTKAMDKAIRAAAKLVLKEVRPTITKKGYPGDKPGKKDLRTSMGVKVKSYRGGVIKWAGVGARTHKPWKAFHSHLYEKGHDMIVSRGERKGETALTTAHVEGKGRFMEIAERTKPRQHLAIVDTLGDYFVKASKK